MSYKDYSIFNKVVNYDKKNYNFCDLTKQIFDYELDILHEFINLTTKSILVSYIT